MCKCCLPTRLLPCTDKIIFRIDNICLWITLSPAETKFVSTFVYLLLQGCCSEYEGRVRKPVNHTGWMTVVNQTYRAKLVCNHCAIEHFGDVFVLSFSFFIFGLYRDFCHMTESDLLLFRTFWWCFCVVTYLFLIFGLYRDFCHMTESDLLLFLVALGSLSSQQSHWLFGHCYQKDVITRLCILNSK